jgi:PhnB protein
MERAMKINPYLSFNGNCREAFTAYEKILGGKIGGLMTFGEAPPEMKAPPGWADKVMHAFMTFGDNELMGADSPPQHYQPMKGIYVALHVETPEDAERVWKGLADGAQIQLELQPTFWAQRFGMLVDRFGTPWMVNCLAKQ